MAEQARACSYECKERNAENEGLSAMYAARVLSGRTDYGDDDTLRVRRSIIWSIIQGKYW